MRKTEKIPQWLSHQTLIHGFSTKKLGNLSFRTGEKLPISRRRREYAKELNFSWENAVIPPLTHSNNVILIDKKSSISRSVDGDYLGGGRLVSSQKKIVTVHDNPEWQSGIDGFLVNVPGVFPVLLTADCAALAFFHPSSQVTAIGHVGIIGAINQLPKKLVYVLNEFCGCNPSELEVVIYPSIRMCHYDLSNSGAWGRIEKDTKAYYGERDEHYKNGYFNLQGFIKRQLLEADVNSQRIYDTNLCTVCNYSNFFSNSQATTPTLKMAEGRFASVIGTKR